jgi:hypothetical protein
MALTELAVEPGHAGFPEYSADRWEARNERASIMEYDGGLSRQEAESKAHRECPSGEGHLEGGLASCDEFPIEANTLAIGATTPTYPPHGEW